jgi:hypothetical protein
MTSFEDQIRDIGYKGKIVKSATVRKIANDIHKLYELVYDVDTNFTWKKYQTMLLDPELLMEGLDEMSGRKGKHITLNTKIGYMASILTAMKSFELENTSAFGDYQKRYKFLQDQRIVINKQAPPTLEIDRKQIEEVVEKQTDPRYWLLLKLYTIYNFRLEVATLEQITEEEFDPASIASFEERNFIVTGNNLRFVFNKYKTSGKYGSRTVMIEKGVFRDRLLEYLKEREGDDFIFFEEIMDEEWDSQAEAKEKVFTRLTNNLSKILQRTFQKEGLEVNATKLAKMIESEAWKSGDIKLIQKIADQRGHSVETAAKVYVIAK